MNKIAIMMRIDLGAESLNNEGNIGNIIQPRQLTIDGEVRQAISGEMLKHIHTRNLRLLADDSELCDGCKIFKPTKDTKPSNVNDNFSKSGNKVANCIIDDIEGFMDVKDGNCKRSSVIKFSTAISTEEVEPEMWLHSRVDPTEEYGKENAKAKKEKGDNSTQMIFHRPIRSNVYALVMTVDLDRIGFDDEKLIYCLDEEQKKSRQVKCINAIKNMFLDLEGAMCSTRLPHLKNIEGILVHKTDKNEVLSKYSPLKDDYIEVNKNISSKSSVFNNVEEFVRVIDGIV